MFSLHANGIVRLLSTMGHWISGFQVAEGKKQLLLHVKTGDRKGAGTDANVWLLLYDKDDRRSEVIKLNRKLRNDNERGSVNTFTAYVSLEFGKTDRIELWRDSFGIGDNWLLERIDVEDPETNDRTHFPVHRWIKPNTHYLLCEYDCCLPQCADSKHNRRQEINDKRRRYCIYFHIQDGPAQARCLPEDEMFSDDYKWDIVKTKAMLLVHTKVIKWTTEKWRSLDNLKRVYKFSLGEPNGMSYWKEDKWFGLQRTQGTNPVLIRLCEQIPSKFAVESKMVEPFLEGYTLAKAIQAKKIFIIDLEILEGITTRDNRVLCHPLALFYLNKKDEVMPIAIQLFQKPGPENPVFLPSDPTYTWILAKMFYNNADASYHQACTHLGFTHLLMEGVVVCTHRNLSPSHPLFKLMAPHFLFLLAINSRGLAKLISPGGWVDKTMSIGTSGMFQLIAKGLERWRLDKDGMIPNTFKERRVSDHKVLPDYPYRDDAVAIWDAIKRYVTKIVTHFYDSNEKIEQDYELHQWREELTRDRKEGGVGIEGIPGGKNGRFTNVDEVIDTVTVIISTCSIGHAAANFQQYDDYAFPPNYPSILLGDVPRDKSPLAEEDILNQLPDKKVTLDIMVITKLLSSKGTNSLGDFEVQYLFDPVSIKAADEFRQELRRISDDIKARNKEREHPYPWLDPDIVPNAISI